MAREIRLDPRSINAGRLGCAGMLLAFALMASGPIFRRWWPEAHVTELGMLVFFAVGLCQIVESFTSYRCPQCGDRLKERIPISSGVPGERNDSGPVHYVRPRCDVEWDSGHVWSDRGD